MRLALTLMMASLVVVACSKKDEAEKGAQPKAVEAAAPAPASLAEPAPAEAAKAPAKAPQLLAAAGQPSTWDDEDELLWPIDTQFVVRVAGGGEQQEMAFGGGASNALANVWSKLGDYRGSYLRTWSQALSETGASATDAVDAFNELAFAVTGPTGFWRDTLPKKWLGCENDPESAPCAQLTSKLPDLKQWDKIQAKLGKMSETRARRFLGRNEVRVMAYFEHYVPDQPSESGMKATAFYRENLADVLP